MPDTKLAVITGGSSGLGFEIARQLINLHTFPFLLARDQSKLSRAVTELGGASLAADITCDIKNENELKSATNKIKDTGKKIDWLVLNAGVVKTCLIRDYTSFDPIAEQIEINLLGNLRVFHSFEPMLSETAKILIISSTFGLVGGAGYASYCASKFGLIGLAEALRREQMGIGRSVHIACPGDMDTPQYEEEAKNAPDWMKKSRFRSKPLSSQKAAERILKGCQKGKFFIPVSHETRQILLIKRFLPEPVYRWLVDRNLPTSIG